MTEIPPKYRGWWRIVHTDTWADEYLDDLGPAMLSLTGSDDRLRVQCLLARVKAHPVEDGILFLWMGAWEFDQMAGSGTARIDRNGWLRGRIEIDYGDESDFVAERAEAPSEPIPDPPSYRDKWRRRR
jgi:hypothetical protein